MGLELNCGHQLTLNGWGEQTSLWVHEHPTAMKVMEAAGFILGSGLLLSIPVSWPVLGIGAAIGSGLVGTTLTMASTVALIGLDFLVPPHHDMRQHVFQARECEGGRLYYEGDVPILSLDSDDPKQAGWAHGYLCGEAIHRLAKRFSYLLPSSEQYKETLSQFRTLIDRSYLLEMEGLVDGYNEWVQEQHWWQFVRKISVEDLLMLHLLPDFTHFTPKPDAPASPAEINRNRQVLLSACASIVKRDPERGFLFARNMDWPSLGLAGTYSLVIHRKRENGLANTVEVGFPGLIGTLTGMNEHGLSLAMNVCTGKTQTIRGMPALFYNRLCLEGCRSVADVEKQTSYMSPLGSYHLTVADKERAESIHFYQADNERHVLRPWNEGVELSTLNYRYTPAPDPRSDMHCSLQRQQQINAFFQQPDNRPFESVLSLPFVNNFLTTHRVLMEPKTGAFQVAFDNAYAGDAPLCSVSLFHR